MAGLLIVTDVAVGGDNAIWLEAYDSTQGYAWSDSAQAERSLRLKQQALEARHKRWIGRGVVRSFDAGNVHQTFKRVVPVPPYDPQTVSDFNVHFLRSGEVKVFPLHYGLYHSNYPLKGEEAELIPGKPIVPIY